MNDSEARLKASYHRYLVTTKDRGANVLSYREWCDDFYGRLLGLIDEVAEQSKRETAYFEQFRGDEPTEQLDPHYGFR